MEYLWAYLVGLVIVIVLNTQFFRKGRNIIHYENIFFLFFLNLGFTWIAIFFSFYTLQDADIALLLSHCSYLISILYIYSFVGFIYFFDTQNSLKIDQKQIILILTGLIGLTILYLSPGITVSMYLDTAGIFRENPGELSIIHTIFTLGAFPIILYTVYNKLRKIRLLARIRFTRIIYSTSLLIVIFVFFQLIFPIYYGIWIFEKELIVIYFMYIGYVSYIIHRYYFASVLQNIGSWIISILAIIFVTEMYTFSDTILPIIGNSFDNFWTQEKPSHYTITILIIVLYLFIVSTLRRIFIGRGDREELKEDILHLQKKIIPITDYISLNILIRKTFKYIFHTHHAEVIIFSEDDTYLHTKNYFQKGDFDNLYIADIVFLEQKREGFPIEEIIREMPAGTFIAFPIFHTDSCKGIFTLGPKSFKDSYTKGEIKILRYFSHFLAGQIEYISTYGDLQDLSIHLDKRVDEKTIEYNDLINKQKEYIGMISHEIRSPISSAIFQSDSILDDLEKGDISPHIFHEELSALNQQLIKIGGLISKLFSVQYYDTHSVSLFLEKIQFKQFLSHEIDLFRYPHPRIQIISNIDASIRFIEIDKIQIQQVITNLLDNAVKFAQNDTPIISVSALKIGNTIEIRIEDNGVGFDGIDIQEVFNKYAIGSKGAVGLGMGLYLCERIITMHRGSIVASLSGLYGGACFTIILPIK